MNIDRKHLIAALGYLVAGMCYGIFMASSKDHSLHVAHAHLLLVGFVTSFVYGVIHKLWLGLANEKIGLIQFSLHHIGTVAMVVGLTLLYGGLYPEEIVGPVLGMSSTAVLLAAILMLYLCFRAGTAGKTASVEI